MKRIVGVGGWGIPTASLLSAAIIDFENPYTIGALSAGTSVTENRPFDGQQGWSQSAGNGAGSIITAPGSGTYTGGQAMAATPSATAGTYIGAKGIGAFGSSFSFDLKWNDMEMGLGGWKDGDGDDLFDQSEAQFMPGTVRIGSTTTFGVRTGGFGDRLSSGTSGSNGNWYRVSVITDFANLRVTLSVHNLTTNTPVALATSVFNLNTTQFGGNPASYLGLVTRITGSSTAAIDNISTDAALPPPPPPPPLPDGVVEVAPSGVWTWFNDNQSIVLNNGRHLVGYVKADGNVAVTSFDPATGTGSESVLSGPGAVQIDDHNNPSLTLLPDGKVLAVYAMHSSQSRFYHRTSLNSDPRTAADWGPQLEKPVTANISYSNTFRLSSESNRIHHFSRMINYNPTVTISDDLGATWGPPTQFIRTGTGSTRPYFRFCSNHNDRIDMIYTDAHPASAPTSIYHLFLHDDQVRRSDNSLIRAMADLPILHDSPDMERGTVVYPYTTTAWGAGEGPDDYIPNGRAWVWDVHYGSDGKPVCVFSVQLPNVTGTGFPHNRIYYYYARWTGSGWQRRFIAQGGSNLYSGEANYAGGICIDPEDTRVVYLSSNAANPFALSSLTDVPLAQGRRYEIHQGFTADGGHTFTWDAVTSNSPADNLRPVVPENHGRARTLVWFNGSYSSYTDYFTRVLGTFGEAVVSYSGWAEGFGLAADSGNLDSDHDGLLNLMEYATGGHPLVSNSPPTSYSMETAAFEFTAMRNHADAEWIIEHSIDLSDWNTAAILRADSLPSTISPGFTLESVAGTPNRYRVTNAASSGDRIFHRLRVSNK